MTHDDSLDPREQPGGTPGEAVVVRSEEELAVGTRRVPYESVRLVKRIVTETRTITTEVRREELHVERRPLEATDDVSGMVEPADDGFEITLHEERVEVRTVVVPHERVRVSRQLVEEQRLIGANVSREELQVERTPPAAG